MSEFVGKSRLTIVLLKSGAQKYVYEGDPYPEDAADGERERHHKRGHVGPEDQEFDPKTKKWGKRKSISVEAPQEPAPTASKPATT